MNEKLLEKTMVKITRGSRIKLKILAALEAKTMEEYLEGLIQREDNKRLLTKSRQDYERDLIDQEMSDPKFEDFSGASYIEGTNNER